ncbi:hypothetical protein NMG60_11015011 [Bertholletia excelsa]
MDSLKASSAPPKSKLAKTLHKVIHLKTATKTLSNTGFCLLIPQEQKLKRHCRDESQCFDNDDESRSRNRAAMEAFMAKLFATISSVKASYAELQLAQFPYDSDAIHSADEAVVQELKSLSELKRSFLKKQIDYSPPHVTFLLTEIQEQQSMMKMYEITMRKMQSEIETKENDIAALEKELEEIISNNKTLEKRLNSSGQFSVLDCVDPSNATPNGFNIALHYAVRSIRSFVKVMIREMESANWDIEAAASAIEPEIVFPKSNHRCFAFESFVCREMFDGFNSHTYQIPNESVPFGDQRRLLFIDRFKKLKAVNVVQFLKNNSNSVFGTFVRSKYLRLVHPKMETSFSGNLGQRKMIKSGEWPDTAFFAAFTEVAKRVWLLHCLAFSFDQEVQIFQVKRNCRFSEVYMESVAEDVFTAAEDSGFRVAFTVVPGFKIGKTVMQSQVYVFPADTPSRG